MVKKARVPSWQTITVGGKTHKVGTFPPVMVRKRMSPITKAVVGGAIVGGLASGVMNTRGGQHAVKSFGKEIKSHFRVEIKDGDKVVRTIYPRPAISKAAVEKASALKKKPHRGRVHQIKYLPRK